MAVISHVFIQGSATFRLCGPYPDPTRFQRAATISETKFNAFLGRIIGEDQDTKKGLRLNFRVVLDFDFQKPRADIIENKRDG